MLPWMFISSYTTIYFFVKNFFFSNVYISVNTIFESSYLFFGWEIGHPWREAHPKCVQLCTAGQWYHASCVRTHLLYHFSSFCLVVFCFICRTLTLLLLKEDVFFKKLLFFSNEINFYCHEISFFSGPESTKTLLN